VFLKLFENRFCTACKCSDVFFTFFGWLVEAKKNLKFYFASMKALTNSELLYWNPLHNACWGIREVALQWILFREPHIICWLRRIFRPSSEMWTREKITNDRVRKPDRNSDAAFGYTFYDNQMFFLKQEQSSNLVFSSTRRRPKILNQRMFWKYWFKGMSYEI
jgi:hypothetical protein